MNGFGASPPTVFDNISIVRAGGRFWGAQEFPAIWLFSADKVFQGIRVSNVDIVDPTYSGVMFQSADNPITDTVLDTVSITGAPVGILVNGARGAATFTGTRLSGNGQDVRNPAPDFRLTLS